eukprot:3096614-Heterocapsa_arctica.AAC.1
MREVAIGDAEVALHGSWSSHGHHAALHLVRDSHPRRLLVSEQRRRELPVPELIAEGRQLS